MVRTVLLCLMALVVSAAARRQAPRLSAPEQVHLFLTGGSGEMGVDWVDSTEDGSGEVHYGTSKSKLTHVATARYNGNSREDLGMTKPNYTLHTAVMTGLTAGETYYYKVGSPTGGYSDVLPFTAWPLKKQPRWAAFGDLGLRIDNWRPISPSFDVMAAAAKAGEIDGVIHAGDFAYNFQTDGGAIGDGFMQQVERTARHVPYMGTVGNHECGGNNLAHYSLRFAGLDHTVKNSGATTGGSFKVGQALWYSWDAGLIHFIALDTEVWDAPDMKPVPGKENCVWNPKTNRALIDEQLEWLEEDLKKATANRHNVPWIVSFGHKAWYMEPGCNFSAFDNLLHKYGADLHLGGHIHKYQRFYPLRLSQYPNHHPADIDFDCASPDGKVYRNPKYMTTIIAGSPGDHEVTHVEGTNCDLPIIPKPSHTMPLAVCRYNYGLGYLQAVNTTHLHWEWELTATGTPKNGSAPPPTSAIPTVARQDELWIVKEADRHRPRDYDAVTVGNEFEGTTYRPEMPFKAFYDEHQRSFIKNGCGELPPGQCGP